MVCGLMSHRVLSELHVVPQKRTVTAKYYVEEILYKTCKDAMNRKAARGDILMRLLLQNMSEAILLQDGAPDHTAPMTQDWFQSNV